MSPSLKTQTWEEEKPARPVRAVSPSVPCHTRLIPKKPCLMLKSISQAQTGTSKIQPWEKYRHEIMSGLLKWLSGKESACQCRRHGFDPWVGKVLWRRKWQPTPVFLLGKSHVHGVAKSRTWLNNYHVHFHWKGVVVSYFNKWRNWRFRELK